MMHADRTPVTTADRRRVIRAMFHEGPRFRVFAWRFATLMALSVCLAVLGLTANSPAVIIGAMVVAPLMGPVLGVAASIVMGWPKRFRHQSLIVLAGAAGAVGLAVVISAIVPGRPDAVPSELLARTEPNILDLAVAMAAGAVGAYTLVRREVAEAMAGAAIAVALVPPLATIGISLQVGRLDMAVGALLLVTANVVGVVFSGAVTLLLIGFVPGLTAKYENKKVLAAVRWAGIAAVLMIVPLQWEGPGVLAPPPESTDVQQVIEDWSGPTAMDVVDLDVSLDDDGVAAVDVVVAASGSLPDADKLADALAVRLGRPVQLQLQQVASLTSEVFGGGG